MTYIYDQLVQDYGAVTFEAFINLLVSWFSSNMNGILTNNSRKVDITEDQTSPEQLRESFLGIAGNKVGDIRLMTRALMKFLSAAFCDWTRYAPGSVARKCSRLLEWGNTVDKQWGRRTRVWLWDLAPGRLCIAWSNRSIIQNSQLADLIIWTSHVVATVSTQIPSQDSAR